jgi:fluoroquinolone transport system ATP-binding protein
MIRIENLSYTYPGSPSPALKSISFTVQKGEIFGFLGPSGAGKSTTQKVLNGLLRGFRGTAIVNGTDMKDPGPAFFEKIGVAFEFPNLYQKLSARENLLLFASFYKGPTADPDELLEKLGLSEDRDTKVAAFSKGMKMRLNFARALINRPEVLFLDEPTSGLDPSNARRMKDMIQDMRSGGVTIFLTTHNMNDAEELCDRIAFMVDGALPVTDEVKALKIKHGKKQVRVSYREQEAERESFFGLDELDGASFSRILKDKKILTIHTLEASMEDIFLKVTGKQLRN